MKRKKYQLTIQYDGSQFHGWQVQLEGRTVQGDIEAALSTIYSEKKITVMGSGRTDAGVHAFAQVAHVELPNNLSPIEICNALNGNLKKDVRIDLVRKAKHDFHARFSATAREYEYHLVKKYSPITRQFAVELKWDVDMDLLHECAKVLIGEHDFTSFCKATAETDNKICNILMAEWEDLRGELIFHIKANRFLQHMVRYLVGTMLEVSRSRYELSDFKALVNGRKTAVVVVKALAKGLFLKKVYYD